MADDLAGAGKVAEATERGTRELREVLRDLAGPAAKEFGEYLGRRIHIYGVVRTVKAAQKARAQILASGLEQQPIPLTVLVPALEGAALEEDEDLATRWAGLLATAATSGAVLPAYADILRQLTPEEARMLDFIYEQSRPVLDEAEGVDKKALQESSGLSQRDFLIRIQNLHRLELVVQLTSGGLEPVRGFRGWGHLGSVGLTALGEAFVLACRGPGILVQARDDA